MINTRYRIGVITNSDGPSMQDLQRVATANNVTFEKILTSYIPITGFKTSQLIKDACQYDIIYYRTGLRDTALRELAHVLKHKRIPLINASAKYMGLHRKIQQALIADRFDIQQPKSIYVKGFDYELITRVLGPKFVVKPDFGSKGNGIVLISSSEELLQIDEQRSKDLYLFQEYLEGADEYRVYTVGKQGVASYKKIRANGDFRANLHTGGSMCPTEPTLEKPLLDFGGHIAECFGADLSGVDILVKDQKMYFLELNWQPGWENLDKMSGAKYSEMTIQYILDRAHQHYSIS